MPELPIFKVAGKFLPDAGLFTLACMAYPNDEDQGKRDALITWNFVDSKRRSSDGDKQAQLTWGVLDVLLDAPSPAEIFEDFGKVATRGARAGFIFLTLYSHARRDETTASVNKAVKTAGEVFGALNGSRADPLTFYSSGDRNLWSHWKTYQPVAHLWAAALVMAHGAVRVDGDGKPTPSFDTQFGVFLRLSENLREWGESFTVVGQKHHHGPVLNRESAWRVPRSLTASMPAWAAGLKSPT